MSIYRERRTLKPLSMNPGREVPRELLLELLEDAQWAPTHGLTQPWRFHMFTTPEARERLGKTLESIYDRLTPEPLRDAAKRAKLTDGPRRAPVVISLLARVEPGGKIPEWEEIAAVSCAAQNLMLSAHEKGLGSFWSTAPASCSREFVDWLGLDESHRALGLIFLGWPQTGEPVPRSVRSPLSERVVWHDEASL